MTEMKTEVRQKWMAALIGACFGVMAVLIFSLSLYSFYSLSEFFGLLATYKYEKIMADFYRFRWAFLISYAVFAMLSALSATIIEKRLRDNKPFARVGIFWSYWIFIFSLGLGINLIYIIDLGFNKWSQELEFYFEEVVFTALVISFISILPTLVYGPLMAFTIKKLGNTRGFGLPYST